MKTIVLSLMLSLSASAFAETEKQTNGYCENSAVEYVNLIHNKTLDDIGTIQGYEENLEVTVTQVQGTEDSYYKMYSEDYTVSISANNDEGDWWVTEYTVTMSAALDKETQKTVLCEIKGLEYKGVVDSGSPEYED